ncbi:PREDICTED: uncharacterized protein LOC106784990 [Polistes canadensis]|uniref:uncharacterized protein LOC106784990 n=1 Tax=Polistes canadensis TaxID=91411 RepID=UPI000718B323|nr:PREDICTED: uncharacterized protein LOC106784990 [Polistes canadensis]
MCLENLFLPEEERISNSPFQFSSNVIPTCWAGVNNPLFTFSKNYHIQMTIFMIFRTDSWMVINKYEKAKKIWEEYVELEQEGLEIEKVQKWMMKREEIERMNRATLYKEEVKIEREEMTTKSGWLNNVVKDKDESSGQLINELAHNENCETNDEITLRNEDSFKSEDLDSSNNKTKTNNNSTDKSQMNTDTCNNYKQVNSKEKYKEHDLELIII